MSSMNVEWAITELDTFLYLTELNFPNHGPGVVSFSSRKITRGSDDDVTRQAYVVEQIFDRVIPAWRDLEANTVVNRWMRHRTAATRTKEALVRQQEIEKNLGESAPELSAAKMHHWIWDGAKSLWQSGHYREAVEAAIKKLNAETQNKVGRRDISESDLFAQAFSLDPPSTGKSRIRRMPNDGSKTFESMQRGAIDFSKGIFTGIRNPLSHEDGHELDEQEALEYLAALSVLARWVDESSMESA